MKVRIKTQPYDFNPDDRAKAENTIKNTWTQFRDSLARKEFKYDETEKALKTTFLNVFNQMFLAVGKEKLTTELMTVFDTNTIGRGTILKPGEETPASRFTPIGRYIKDDNRFSPPGIEWLYLAIGDTDEHIKRCAEAECRAEKGNRFGFCHFSLSPGNEKIKIVDLTKMANDNYDKINSDLIAALESKKNDAVKEILGSGNLSISNTSKIVTKYKEKYLDDAQMWALKTYSNMLSEQIFVPIEDSNKKLEYTPFQTMAKYFEGHGFGGIIYKSTKYDKAKNLVLFDKNSASPTGSIDDYIIE